MIPVYVLFRWVLGLSELSNSECFSMSYYNRYKNRRGGQNGDSGNGMNNNNSQLSANGGLQPADAIFDLGKNKRVTVRQFRNINLIDIREYYLDQSSGEMKPGKKGISLTEDLYDELLKHRLNIDEALRRFGSKRARTKMVRLLSDDEDDDDTTNNDKNGNDRIKNEDKDGNSTNRKKKSREDREREEGDDSKRRKKQPAPPTLLPHEENLANAKREANATLVIPGLAKKEVSAKKVEDPPKLAEVSKEQKQPLASEHVKQSATTETASVPEATTVVKAKESTKSDPKSVDDEDNSSDEEFAQSLEEEMNKIFDDISEEE